MSRGHVEVCGTKESFVMYIVCVLRCFVAGEGNYVTLVCKMPREQ